MTDITATETSTETATEITGPTGSVHDFDFLVGTWAVANRRLRERGVGCQEWDEFPAQMEVIQRLDGVVNVDQIDFPTKGFSGLTIRSFDHEQQSWSIYWINSGRGVLDPPVIGGFSREDGQGVHGRFFGEDVDNGVAVRVVFDWTRIDQDHARWQQAFSTDGESWETNWVMEMTRSGAATLTECPPS